MVVWAVIAARCGRRCPRNTTNPVIYKKELHILRISNIYITRVWSRSSFFIHKTATRCIATLYIIRICNKDNTRMTMATTQQPQAHRKWPCVSGKRPVVREAESRPPLLMWQYRPPLLMWPSQHCQRGRKEHTKKTCPPPCIVCLLLFFSSAC